MPVITASPVSSQIEQGASTALYVTATNPVGGTLSYQWYRNGAALTGATSSAFGISNATPANSGTYYAVVSNTNGSISSSPASLYVIDAIALTYNMDQTPVAGTNAIIDATGHTVGTIFKTPLPLSGSGATINTGNCWDFSSTDAYLSIPATNPALQNFGNIQNAVGMTIAFWYKPAVPMSYSNSTAPATFGSNFKIDWLFDADFKTLPECVFGDGVSVPQLKLAGTVSHTNNIDLMRDGNWHHFVYTLDYRNPKDASGVYMNNVAAYIDGTLYRSSSFVFQDSFMPLPTDSLTLGAPSHNVRQLWDQFIIYNFPLNADQVQQLYTTGTVPRYAPQLLVGSSADYATTANPTVNLTGTVCNFGQSLPVTTQWSVVSQPVGGSVTFADPSSVNTTATFSNTAPGTYSMLCTASNAAWSSTSTLVNIQVLESFPLTAYASAAGAPNATVLTGTAVNLNGSSRLYNIPNPAGVTYLWSMISGPAACVFSDPSNPNSTVTLPQPGTYLLELTVTSGTSTNSTTVTLTAANELMTSVFGTVSPQVMLWPANTATVSGSAAESNSGRAINYSWSQVVGSGTGVATFANPTSATSSVAFSSPGVYQLVLTASNAFVSGTAPVWVNVWAPMYGRDSTITPPAPRQYHPQPPPYVHPRFLFTETDRPEMTARASSDPVASAAVTSLRNNVNATILNPGAVAGRCFQQLLAGNRSYTMRNVDGFWTDLAQGCYVAWLDKNASLMQQLATVIANSARDELLWNPSPPTGADRYIGVCYDLAYNSMTEDQRSDTRTLLSRMTYGVNLTQSADGAGRFLQFLPDWYSLSMAIYGEAGYDDFSARLNFSLIKYGFSGWPTTPQGWASEDTSYGGLTGQAIVLHAQACRQFEPLIVTGGVTRQTQMDFFELYPDKSGMSGHSEGGWPNSGQKYLMDKFFYPTDQLSDLVRSASPVKGDLLYEAMFGTAPLATPPTLASVASVRHLPITKFDPQRGIGNTRSDWTASAASMDFDCRFDTFDSGHIHYNRNDFSFFALGRVWVYEGSYGQFENELHSTIAIDGTGAGKANPAKFVDVYDHDQITAFTGDASFAYTYSSTGVLYSTSSNTTSFHWSDFIFPGSSDGTIPPLVPPPLNNQPVSVPLPFDTSWPSRTVNVDLGTDGNFVYANPVQRAFRTAILIRGPAPYMLVLDDIQKDAASHTYQWMFQATSDLQARSTPTATDAILYHSGDGSASGVPQCLVRAVQADGTASPITVGSGTINGQSTNRLILTRQAVAPNFKVLLFPHHNGDALPTTVMNGNKLTVTLAGGQTDQFTFTTGTDGRTRYLFQRLSNSTPPVISTPGTILAEATGPGGAAVNFTTSAADNVGNPVTTVNNPASGSNFAFGNTTVIVTATDSLGYSSTSSFVVTVRDTTPPAITVPSPITVKATAASGAVVTFVTSAGDAVSGSVPCNATPASGSVFPKGLNTVNVWATDAAGNTGTNSFTVAVLDTTLPTISVPANCFAAATSSRGATVNLPGSAVDSAGQPIPVSFSPPSGSLFPVGVSTAVATATDAAGNIASKSFVVTVSDVTAPTITVPAGIRMIASGTTGAVVTFTTSAVDALGNNVPTTNNPASGTSFPPGPTVVVTTAVDSYGNRASKTFNVYVTAAKAPVQGGNLKLHLDASASATLVAGTNGRVSRWNDADGGPIYAMQSGTANQPTALIDSNLGMRVVDFGPCLANADGQWMQFMTGSDSSASISTIRSVFTVMKGGNTILGDGYYYNFYRGGDIVTPTSPLFDASYASGGLKYGLTWLNAGATPVNPVTTSPPASFWEASVTSTNSVTASRLASDRIYHSGGQTIAEVLIYDRLLTESERHATEAYLMAKWFQADTTGLVINTPPDMTVEATGSAGASVNFTVSVNDALGSLPFSVTPPSGSTFPFGSTPVTVTATNSRGYVQCKTFYVNVTDTTPPAITVPANITVSSGGGAVPVSFTTSAVDAVSGTCATTDNPASGSLFPVGVTTVTTTAFDQFGNSATRTFTVTVTSGSALPAPTGLIATAWDGQVDLDWNPVSGSTSYNVERSLTSGTGYVLVASGVTNPFFSDASVVNGSTYYYVVTASGPGGASAASNEAIAMPKAGAGFDLWGAADIGSPSLSGSTVYTTGTYTIVGAGSDIYNSADQFQFMAQPVVGDATIIARVLSLQNTNTWAKAGVMMRESLAPGSKFVTMLMTAGQGSSLEWRNATNGYCGYLQTTGITVPYWIKLVRSGSTYSAYRSPDGVNWTQQNTSQTLGMSGTLYVGLAVTSHNTAARTTAAFDNVNIVPGYLWSAQDIGAPQVPGFASYSGSTQTINAAGADISGTSDQCRFVSLTGSADCSITARVVDLEETDAWAKAGVAIRETLSGNSANAAILATADNGVVFQARTVAGGTTSTISQMTGVTAPIWVRLGRAGNTFTAYASSDGVSWSSFGTVTIPMAATTSLGLESTSHNPAALGTADFDNITPQP